MNGETTMQCPYLKPDNRCRVASELAEFEVKTSANACDACQRNSNPQAINVVTIGMALVNRRRRRKPVSELKKLLANYMPENTDPGIIKFAAFQPGPGSELKKMLTWFARPSESCSCETRAATMNDWGVAGCRENLDTIIEWLIEEAQIRGLPHGKFTRVVARQLVLTAIRKHERQLENNPVATSNDASAAE